MTRKEQVAALQLVNSVILRCGRMAVKFAPGTSQHTLLKNRIQALEIAKSLLSGGGTEQYSESDLSAAAEQLTSILRKCEKARSKYQPDSGQYGRYDGTIRAMELSCRQIENERSGR